MRKRYIAPYESFTINSDLVYFDDVTLFTADIYKLKTPELIKVRRSEYGKEHILKGIPLKILVIIAIFLLVVFAL